MSIAAMNWVFFDSGVSGLDKLVLLALADEADDQGGSCYPSMRRLATKTSLSVGGVRNAIGRLEDAGVLVVDRPAKQGRGHHNRYVLQMDMPVDNPDGKGTPHALLGGERVHEGSINARPMARANPVSKDTYPQRAKPVDNWRDVNPNTPPPVIETIAGYNETVTDEQRERNVTELQQIREGLKR